MKMSKRLLAFIMTAVLVFGVGQPSVMAYGEDMSGEIAAMEQTAMPTDLATIEMQTTSPAALITTFADLPTNVTNQTVPFGTEVAALNLPVVLTATTNATEDYTITVPVNWSSTPEFEGFAGEYIFTAAVQGDFVVAEGVEPPVIVVEVEPIGIMPLSENIDIGGSVMSGPGWEIVTNNPALGATPTSPVLLISGSGPFLISGTTTNRRIVIDDNVTADVTIQNLNINLAGLAPTEVPAIPVGSNTGNSTLNLTISGTNTIQASPGSAGINVLAVVNATLNIYGDGTLNSTGGSGAAISGAGIGGSMNLSAGTINIHPTFSGIINATGGTTTGGQSAAGIGGGNTGGGGTITIGGGTADVIIGITPAKPVNTRVLPNQSHCDYLSQRHLMAKM